MQAMSKANLQKFLDTHAKASKKTKCTLCNHRPAREAVDAFLEAKREGSPGSNISWQYFLEHFLIRQLKCPLSPNSASVLSQHIRSHIGMDPATGFPLEAGE